MRGHLSYISSLSGCRPSAISARVHASHAGLYDSADTYLVFCTTAGDEADREDDFETEVSCEPEHQDESEDEGHDNGYDDMNAAHADEDSGDNSQDYEDQPVELQLGQVPALYIKHLILLFRQCLNHRNSVLRCKSLWSSI